MDKDAQIRLLIDNAPQDGITPQLIVAIAPVLNAVATKLKHTQYYILQDINEHWVLTTLSNRANPELSKRVIYAYPTLQDVTTNAGAGDDPQFVAALIPVIDVLFQLVALEPVDSIVFFETPGTIDNTIEVQRSHLQALIQQVLGQNHNGSKHPTHGTTPKKATKKQRSAIPDDIA
jgi:hypothetical protein